MANHNTRKVAKRGDEKRRGNFFRMLAVRTSAAAGSPWAFLISVSVIVVWALSGPLFHYSDTWQLVVNTATTIVTFLMVFLIQNSQNRDVRAIHLKLDEIIRGSKGPRTGFVDLEELSDEELDQLYIQFQKLQKKERAKKSAS